MKRLMSAFGTKDMGIAFDDVRFTAKSGHWPHADDLIE